jgi:hypothetical protein
MDINWVTRAAWQAARSSGSENVWGNVKVGIAVHWTGSLEHDQGHKACLAEVRGIQRYHQQNKGWADIAYNYLICRHGYVFVGRGLTSASAAQGTTAGNRTYVAVCFLLGIHDAATGPAIDQFNALREYLMQRKVGRSVKPHLRFTTTECPGRNLTIFCETFPY